MRLSLPWPKAAALPHEEPKAPVVRVLVVGRGLALQQIERILAADGVRGDASSYTCVDGLDAAQWLLEEGIASDVIIVDAGLFADAASRLAWVKERAEAKVVPVSPQTGEEAVAASVRRAIAACRAPEANVAPVGGYLAAASRRTSTAAPTLQA